MAKYKKKPVVIEAEVYKKGMEDGFLWGNYYIPKDAESYPKHLRSEQNPGYLKEYDNDLEHGDYQPYIDTLEGKMIINEGDYIITGVKNERYPCKPDIFKMTYSKVVPEIDLISHEEEKRYHNSMDHAMQRIEKILGRNLENEKMDIALHQLCDIIEGRNEDNE